MDRIFVFASQRFSFIASSSLLSSCRCSVNWIQPRLRNSLFTNGISIQSCENESLGRKCLGVSLAHPDSSIYQKLSLATYRNPQWNWIAVTNSFHLSFIFRIKKIQINRSIRLRWNSIKTHKIMLIFWKSSIDHTDERFISKIYYTLIVWFFITENNSAPTAPQMRSINKLEIR